MRILLTLGDLGATFRGLAERCGLRYQHLEDYTDEESGRLPRLSIPEELGLRFALVFYEGRLAAIRAELFPGEDDLMERVLELSLSSGVLSGRLRDALRRGHLSDEDLDAIESEAHAAKAHLAALLIECSRRRGQQRSL